MVLFHVVSCWLRAVLYVGCHVLVRLVVLLVLFHWVFSGAAADGEGVVVEATVVLALGIGSFVIGDAQVNVGDSQIVILIIRICKGWSLVFL